MRCNVVMLHHVKDSTKGGEWRPYGFDNDSGYAHDQNWRHEFEAYIQWVKEPFNICDEDIGKLNEWIITKTNELFGKEQLGFRQQRYFNHLEGSIDIEYDDCLRDPKSVITVHITPIQKA